MQSAEYLFSLKAFRYKIKYVICMYSACAIFPKMIYYVRMEKVVTKRKNGNFLVYCNKAFKKYNLVEIFIIT